MYRARKTRSSNAEPMALHIVAGGYVLKRPHTLPQMRPLGNPPLLSLKTDNKLRCEFSGQSLVHKGVYPIFCSSAVVLFCRCQMLPKDVRFIASHIGASLMYSEDLMSVLVVNLNGIACNAHGDGLADVGNGDAVAMACL